MTGKNKCLHCHQNDDGTTRCVHDGAAATTRTFQLFGVKIGVLHDGEGSSTAVPLRKSKSDVNLKGKHIREFAAADESGYLTDGIHYSETHQKKRGLGKPWSEEEHRKFLEGLEILGKGDWKGISTKFVLTKKSSQVASHAQKYFNRLNMSAEAKRRRRHSVFDISLNDDVNHHQPLQAQGSQSNNPDIASSSSAAGASKETVEEPIVLPSTPNNVTTSDQNSAISPMQHKLPRAIYHQPRVSTITTEYQNTQSAMPTISWVQVLNYSNVQNGVFAPSFNGRYEVVGPQPSLNAWRQRMLVEHTLRNLQQKRKDELNNHIRNLRV